MRPGKTRKKIPTFAFVVDGQTEIWYLQMFKRNEEKFNNLRINIKPEIPQKKKFDDQLELVLEQAKSEYDKVFWIVDLDVVLKETRESKTGETSLKKFLSFLNELKNPKSKKDEESYSKIKVIVNNPCLEYWFLLHFDPSGKPYRTCGEVVPKLKKHLKGYEKTERYFKKRDLDIYTRLKPHLGKAITNASSLGEFNQEYPEKGICEMDKLFLCDELKDHFKQLL